MGTVAYTLGTKETSESVSLLPRAVPTYYMWNIDCKLEITNMNICVKHKAAANKFNTERICTYQVCHNNKSNRYVGLERYGTRKDLWVLFLVIRWTIDSKRNFIWYTTSIWKSNNVYKIKTRYYIPPIKNIGSDVKRNSLRHTSMMLPWGKIHRPFILGVCLKIFLLYLSGNLEVMEVSLSIASPTSAHFWPPEISLCAASGSSRGLNHSLRKGCLS
jgi:hypothetical protein